MSSLAPAAITLSVGLLLSACGDQHPADRTSGTARAPVVQAGGPQSNAGPDGHPGRRNPWAIAYWQGQVRHLESQLADLRIKAARPDADHIQLAPLIKERESELREAKELIRRLEWGETAAAAPVSAAQPPTATGARLSDPARDPWRSVSITLEPGAPVARVPQNPLRLDADSLRAKFRERLVDRQLWALVLFSAEAKDAGAEVQGLLESRLGTFDYIADVPLGDRRIDLLLIQKCDVFARRIAAVLAPTTEQHFLARLLDSHEVVWVGTGTASVPPASGGREPAQLADIFGIR